MMEKLRSLSLFVGTGECNAHCRHCAGVPLRKYAPRKDGKIDEGLISRTLEECYDRGARNLTLSSSGEPTLSPLSVTKTMMIIYSMRNERRFDQINLYSNGIRIGEDNRFCNKYLLLWRDLGLDFFYITVHSDDEKENARKYGVHSYPPLKEIFERIHKNEMRVRANLVLSRENVDGCQKFKGMVERLLDLGVDGISAWPIRNLDDKVDIRLSPPAEELRRMQDWISSECYDGRVRLLEDSKKKYLGGEKLTLFPNGVLSNSWCN